MRNRLKNRFPVIVFGTTPDYVEKLFCRYPDDLLFILDNRYRKSPDLKGVDLGSVVFTNIGDFKKTVFSMKRYFSRNEIVPKGMGCFDCESLMMASETALELGLRFPSAIAVRNARNKYISKRIWRESGISTPIAVIASNLRETIDFSCKCSEGTVLKPLSGSGSELVFYCRNKKEIRDAVETLFFQLERRMADQRHRMEQNINSPIGLEGFRSWVAEEFIRGPEFSCDFVLQDDHITILRTSGKIKDEEHPFGTILAYTLPAYPPPALSQKKLSARLRDTVSALGFNWGWFMVDFVVRNEEPVILEISPRPGGDSIPDLIEFASGEDILGMYLDMMSGRCNHPNKIPLKDKVLASVNLFASENGWINELDISGIKEMNSVLKVFITRNVNDCVRLPPFDYDSWKIGYCIISVDASTDLIETQKILQKRITLSIEDFSDTPPELSPGMMNIVA